MNIFSALVLFLIVGSVHAQEVCGSYNKSEVGHYDSLYLTTLTKSDSVLLRNNNYRLFSKDSPRYSNGLSESVDIGLRKFKINNILNKGIHSIQVFEQGELIQTIRIPVKNPLPEVHQYECSLMPYKDFVILIMDSFYGNHYILIKYDTNGRIIQKTELAHSIITHRGANEYHHDRYLHFYKRTCSQLVFTSNKTLENTFVTRFLNLEDFNIIELNRAVQGIVVDNTTGELAGTVSVTRELDSTTYKFVMLDKSEFEFKLEIGSQACELILHDSLLFMATHNTNTTGATLCCYDMKGAKMKWIANVLQVQANHSQYKNDVFLTLQNDLVILEGHESHGNYLQIFDVNSGNRLASFGLVND